VKKAVVVGLMYLCAAIDYIPVYRRRPEPEAGRHWTGSQWGCWPLRLSRLSVKLEQRWKID
jgi:hypothetical protein